jgi:hypothetical protein
MRRAIAAGALAVGAVALLSATSASGSPGATCLGKTATIQGAGTVMGTPGNDVIVGSAAADTIDGLIQPLQQDDEGIGGRSRPLRPYAPWEEQRGRSNERCADRRSPVDQGLAVHLLPLPLNTRLRFEQGHCCSEERGLGVAKATTMWRLPQGRMGATRLAERLTLCPCDRCVNTAGAASMLIGWGGPVWVRANNPRVGHHEGVSLEHPCLRYLRKVQCVCNDPDDGLADRSGRRGDSCARRTGARRWSSCPRARLR